tara:strand:- start:648 stop:1175 length:528 start_codon:yes stop_codon:yes gene_type:complete
VKSHDWSVIHSSADQCWRTPTALFDRLNEEFGFTIDAAALKDSALCEEWFGPDHPIGYRRDALAQPWNGVVWCNPPYGRGVNKWVEKCAAEAKRGSTVVLLIMANTDTTYFHEHGWKATEIRLIRGRVKFLRKDGSPAGSAPKGSALLIFTQSGNLHNDGDPFFTSYRAVEQGVK